MNSLEQNNYVQYYNRNGKVKTKSVVFEDNGTNTTFEVKGIDEQYFLIAVYQYNIKVEGVGFDNLDNNDMLGFINANIVDLDSIPQNSWLNPEDVVIMSYNNQYYNSKKGILSGLGASSDCEDLKYLKSLMSSLYPSANFTYLPHYVDWSSTPVFSFPQTMDMFIASGKGCYFMTVYAKDTGAVYQYENKLKPFKVSGMSTSLVYDNFDNFPFLFTSFYMNSPEPSVGRFIAKGYKVISDIDLFN